MSEGAVNEPQQIRCGRCRSTPRLVHKMLDLRTGGTLRMYRCECGEQIWTTTNPE
jgi:hypothetical protein